MTGGIESDGALHIPAVLDAAACDALALRLAPELVGRPGRRLTADLDPWLASLTALAQNLAGKTAFPVRAVIFDKTPAINWSVAKVQSKKCLPLFGKNCAVKQITKTK